MSDDIKINTELEAVKISMDMWKWLSENPDKTKHQYPKYNEYRIYLFSSECSLCHYYNSDCNKCCLYKYGNCSTGVPNSQISYYRWIRNTVNLEARKVAAEEIYETLKKRYEELILIDKYFYRDLIINFMKAKQKAIEADLYPLGYDIFNLYYSSKDEELLLFEWTEENAKEAIIKLNQNMSKVPVRVLSSDTCPHCMIFNHEYCESMKNCTYMKVHKCCHLPESDFKKVLNLYKIKGQTKENHLNLKFMKEEIQKMIDAMNERELKNKYKKIEEQKMKDNIREYKVYCKDEETNIKVQEHAFKLGWKWGTGKIIRNEDESFLYFSANRLIEFDKDIYFVNFKEFPHEELTPEEFLRLSITEDTKVDDKNKGKKDT